MVFLFQDMRHLGFRGQSDQQSKKQHFNLFVMLKLMGKVPFQFVCHAEINGKSPLICTSSSSGS